MSNLTTPSQRPAEDYDPMRAAFDGLTAVFEDVKPDSLEAMFFEADTARMEAEAEVKRLAGLLAEAREVMEQFAAVPAHGLQGGPLIGMAAWYGDFTDARDPRNIHADRRHTVTHETFKKLRAFLLRLKETPNA